MTTAAARHAAVNPSLQSTAVSSPGGVIRLMENHDGALRIWREAGVRDRILVHIDAHHDMWWLESDDSLSIANFLCAALKEQIVRELYWVVPDATWQTRAGRAALRRHLRKLQERYPGECAPAVWGERRISTELMRCRLVICSLDTLPPPTESVLLDIDVDYLTIPRVSYGEWDTHSLLPWRWPDELVRLLIAKRVSSDLVTISYSVEGGHTPLEWKYLGDELAARLGDAEPLLLHPYVAIRQGATAARAGDRANAESAFVAVGDRLGAAPYFWLAHVLVDQGRADEAREWHRRALLADPSYRNAYPLGMTLYFEKSDQAEMAFERSLVLEPANAHAQLGLGWIAADRKRWQHAEDLARKALVLSPTLIDAYRLLARALEKQARLDEAIAAYEQSLKLALAGHRPYNAVITSAEQTRRLLDCDHPRVHARLGRLYRRKGLRDRAIVAYRIAIAGGCDIPAVRFDLAALCARQRRWREAARHAACAIISTSERYRR